MEFVQCYWKYLSFQYKYTFPTALFVKFGLNPGPKLYPTLALYWLNWWSQNDNKVRYYQSCFGFLKRYYHLGQYWNQPVVHTFVQPWPKVDSIFHITIGHDEFDVVEEFFDEDVQIGLVFFWNLPIILTSQQTSNFFEWDNNVAGVSKFSANRIVDWFLKTFQHFRLTPF